MSEDSHPSSGAGVSEPPDSPPGPLLAGSYLGLLLFAGAVLLIAVGQLTSYGLSFVLIAPFVIGLVLGTYVCTARSVVGIVTVVGLGAMLGAAVISGLAGGLCAAIFAVIVIVPFWTGVEVGGRRRRKRGREGLSRPNRTTALLLLLSPLGTGLVESNIPRTHALKRVETSRVMVASPIEAWRALVFFEEVELEPPWLTRIGLPRPLQTEGDIQAVGDIKVCTYDTGHLTKRVTHLQPGQLLRFDVIEQTGIEDRSIELVSGSFRFEPLESGQTKITLTTVYRPLLRARAVWWPFEKRLATTLHEYVLDGIESRLAETPGSTSGARQ